MIKTVQGPLFGQSPCCEPILRALPEWFGIEEALQQYVREIDALPTFLAFVEELPAGFLTLKRHSPYAAELYVMGVLPAHHRQGLGRMLVEAGERFLREQGVEF